ncbi:diguanylate cyclase [Piscinibacter sakaiensis]|uniref:diguanylate cyclase n=1 Tax=Piscinibacter sakaiensis TaxID=1547922 RepID=A0A0K8P8Q8_PISS1|nr:diguanylate cyclase [Piscinibacter sakaiensis]GAP38575.1 diguanylate cyclase with GGDEF domain [Piscinibacter sakaiensis]
MPHDLATPLTVLVVDDQAASRVAIAALLDAAGHRVIEADAPEWAVELFRRHAPDLVLLDVEMPGQDGYWVAREMRAAESGGWTPIVFLSSRGDELDLWSGIEAGGDDYLIKPVSPMVLKAKLLAMSRLSRMQQRLVQLSDELQAANQRLRHLSDTDALTGLLNRRGFDARLRTDLAVARRTQQPLTLLLCDLDEFKAYNDHFGHVDGDACLRRVAELLRGCCLRPSDSASRYGGEEFALILPAMPRSGAMTFARGLLRTLETLALPHPASRVAPHVTLSGGITTCVPDDTTTAEGLLTRADEALYAAKARGRRRLFSFEMQVDAVDVQREARVAVGGA